MYLQALFAFFPKFFSAVLGLITSSTGISAADIKPGSLPEKIVHATIAAVQLFRVIGCKLPPVCREDANKCSQMNFCVVVICVCGEEGLFQQPSNGDRPHLFSSV